jgi:hypothetical protein
LRARNPAPSILLHSLLMILRARNRAPSILLHSLLMISGTSSIISLPNAE